MSPLHVHFDVPETIPEHRAELVKRVMRNAGFTQGHWRATLLLGGCSNNVYKCEEITVNDPESSNCLELPSQRVVVKQFGDWTCLRSNPMTGACVNRIASDFSIAPCVFFAGAEGICQDWMEGIVLEKRDFEHSTLQLLGGVASLLASLHSCRLPFEQSDFQSVDAVLLLQFHNMVNYMRSLSGPLPSGTTLSGFCTAFANVEEMLVSLDLLLMLCHNDTKPANIVHSAAIANNGELQLRLVDFDLSGPSFRGYDLFKPFSNIKDAQHQIIFLKMYLQAMGSLESSQALLHEVLLFEPLTLLERCVVHSIEFMLDPNPAMELKAITDWNNFENARHLLQQHSLALKSLRTSQEGGL